MVYETGETEELCVDEVVRDGIMSIGWVPASQALRGPLPLLPQQLLSPKQLAQQPQNTSESAGQLSVAGAQRLPSLLGQPLLS